LPRDAAIKLVRADSQGSELISRWERAAQLSHPHLVRLIRIGSWHGNPIALHYVVMEYAEEDMASVLTERPLTVPEVREMLEPVLDAVAYIHGEGLVHGHLKPSNILAVGEQLKISCDEIRRVGELGGGARKPNMYDPPELKDGEFSPAGDIWSLGMTVVEALTLRLPSRGSNHELVIPETLPAVFFDIARGCLQPDPQRRSTLGDIVDRLQQPSFEPQGQSPARSHQMSRKWRYGAPVATVGLALAAILGGARLLHRPRPSPGVEQAGVQAEPNQQQPVKSEAGKFAEDAKGAKPGLISSPSSPASPPKSTPNLSGDSTAGQVVRQVLPEAPQKARDTIRGKVTVSVRVSVDEAGKVVSAQLDSPGPSRYFAELSLQAARRWQFRPPRVRGQSISSEWTVRFEFSSTEIAVRPVQISR
jgi:TonB family protein